MYSVLSVTINAKITRYSFCGYFLCYIWLLVRNTRQPMVVCVIKFARCTEYPLIFPFCVRNGIPRYCIPIPGTYIACNYYYYYYSLSLFLSLSLSLSPPLSIFLHTSRSFPSWVQYKKVSAPGSCESHIHSIVVLCLFIHTIPGNPSFDAGIWNSY